MSSVAPADDRKPPPVAYRREKKTRRSVILADRLADWTISVGGVLVILAVFAIMVFLASVVVPLFTGGKVTGRATYDVPAGRDAYAATVDEYRTLALQVGPDGRVGAFHVPTGKPMPAPSFDFAGKTATAFARTLSRDDVAFGFGDGTVRFGRLGYAIDILPGDARPPDLVPLDGRDATDGRAIYSRIAAGQIRKLTPVVSLDEPVTVAEDGSAIVAVDYRRGGTVERPTRAFATVDAKGVVRLSIAESRMNMLTRKVTTRARSSTLPTLPAGTRVRGIVMTDMADQVYVGDEGGTIHRYDSRDLNAPALAESIDLLGADEQLTQMRFLIGENALVLGGSKGTVDVYFRLPRAGATTSDGHRMVRAHRLEPHGGPVVGIGVSQRGRTFVTADAGGAVWVRHSTSAQTLLKLGKDAASGPRTLSAVLLAPRDDAVLALDRDGTATYWSIHVPHPETTLATIFGKVWYEGYPGPEYTWQSSSGTDSFEPKLSLVPLIFGTLKATLYSLLFAVPIALLAAVYTSEFVHRRVRAVVKPTMEMMASLPSVVLGFIAALILAPLVETWLSAVLLAFLAIPLSLFAGAHLWQLLPGTVARRLGGVPKFALMFLAIALGAWLSWRFGTAMEGLLFGGSFRAWVNGDFGTGTPFLFLVLLPVMILAAAVAFSRLSGDRLADLQRALPLERAGLLDLIRGLAVLVVGAGLAWAAAAALTALGYDPRGGMVDTYVQRNTLVVGFAMGFAVIPIIYTIAEDALNAVPEHLRGASLACGATPWQTAINVILPTAVSGVFAAVMVGMGRAVGETMIVVMAAGNTPLLDWNVFNGLRALSANIAVELPEAVKDDTLYRMLFLAALTLFVVTFVVNTAAEIIRQRFRKRAVQL